MSPSSSQKETPPATTKRDDVDSPHAEDGEVSDHITLRSPSLHPESDEAKVAHPPSPTDEHPPPLPDEAPPGEPVDDGWEPIWDDRAQAFYFFNRFTNVSQWENPRAPDAQQADAPGAGQDIPARRAGGYDPAIHGDYDPNADYAKAYEIPSQIEAAGGPPGIDPAEAYAATAAFNRFTGKWQRADLNPDNFSDEQKSRRQMNAFFDVDAAANSHDGRSLRAERASKKLTKAELKAFKEKRREKKEEKRRAWLRD
ncbi:uncharacterized protein Z518_11341 [Rhinocladiella mackenziei CBS 650.93]|uniref:Rhinocladiella mackenziei CBS 650.93 unplaced genomic scaffold supercont1.13, whole genome shotgun sequence n=1 Tax=Rhinocladiella mackenziei CBS 650.93 TaxID=1442369 RepID=A0A0D2I0U9_9EURO|nr:uncharacterized protein Z518_11341 [Rhinocladiella mackenziei CBS 650.93]KIW99353.1 hypothetical protein Z518_11341 [Rhinocladiella mackenziei CBS 650.93]